MKYIRSVSLLRGPAQVLPALTLAAALASCGGGDSTKVTVSANFAPQARAQAAVNPDAWVTVPVAADPLLQNLNIPPDAPTRGMWSGVQSWPLNGLHVVLLPNGKVLSYGTNLDGGAQNGRYFDVWNPSFGFGAGSHQTSFEAARQDSFCSTATFLIDGRLLVSGGNGNTTSTLYTSATNSSTTAAANLADSRWYATLVTLPDGRPLMLGGMNPYSEGMQDNPDQAVSQGLASMTPEIYENNAWRSLFGANSRLAFGPDYLRASYPRAWVAPNGQVFGISAEQMWYLDPAGNGSVRSAGQFKQAPSAGNPVNVGATNTAVMYDIGKILMIGGNGSFNGDGLPASNMVTAVDINGANPALSEQVRMSFARRFGNAVVLSDGKVVVTGGTTLGNNNGSSSVFAAEIWNPANGTWARAANAAVYRGYHSITLLLPNGTVLSTGGGTPGPVTNLNAEVYFPPNLFRANGSSAQLAPRPVMKAISGLSYANGATMQIDMADSGTISGLVLLGNGIGTHSFNGGQRRIPLAFTQDGFRLTATLPGNTLAPPGYYMAVALDAAGVPSLGTIIAVGQGVSTPPVPTTPYTPPDLSATNISAPIISAGGTAAYSATAASGVTYSWNFGDGSPATAFSSIASASHTYAQPGVYGVTLTARAADGSISTRSFLQGVSAPSTARKPSASSAVATGSGSPSLVWIANPDNNSVGALNTSNNTVTEVTVGTSPRNVAVAPDGRVWVTNKGSATISIVSPSTLAVVQTITLPRASQPHGLAIAPDGSAAYVVLEATGTLLKLNPSSGATLASAAVGGNARHVSVSADAASILVSRFITPPLPGESTANVDTSSAGAEVVAVNAATMAVVRTVTLRHSDKTDTEIQGSGIPNYLGAAVIAPDGLSAWVPSKQDNIKRGMLRNGQQLDFQNTVRAISSRIDMTTLAEDFARRIDHDNASVGSAAAFHPSGVYLFVALETSRQVAVVDAFGGRELFRIDVGRAPQGLALSSSGTTLYVQNFMDRSVSVIDLTALLGSGSLSAQVTSTVRTIGAERLTSQVLLGKQLFYDARDPRLARDSYMSCASCHNDGGHDGRVWDFTGVGEGLRNTVSLKGRAGVGQGFLHWSANFDELQDFERQIREFAGGAGLMTDAAFNTGTRSQPLGDRKTGVSADLDALSAYVTSLAAFELSPLRNNDGSLTTSAAAGRTVFQSANCMSCHGGNAFTISADAASLSNVGTIKPASGQRLGGTLTGIDVPTLRDAWATSPYLHDGSAVTIEDAVRAHSGVNLSSTDLANVGAFVRQIGAEEAAVTAPGTGTTAGLRGEYFANTTLSGTPTLTRAEAVNFDWGNGSPGTPVASDNFSVRWSGAVRAGTSGTYRFQTVSDDGIRLWVNGSLLINNWTDHAPTTNTSASVSLTAGQRYTVRLEYYERGGGAVARLRWRTPGSLSYVAIPSSALATP